MAKYDIDSIRMEFPCLSKTVNGIPAAFLDGPGGTQVPRIVTRHINDYLYYYNANAHGNFLTSHESDAMVLETREVYADFFKCKPEEIVFGASTSDNAFRIAFALTRTMEASSEILITDIDHEANRSPWRTMADYGMIIKSAKVNKDTCTLNMDDFESKLNPNLKLVAVNWAANACGTITDVKRCIELVREKAPDAIAIVDAVHYAPHKPMDVKDIDADIVFTSSYKYCGPHLGIMYVRKEMGEAIKAVRVMADDNTQMPYRLEVGTQAMELIWGAKGAMDFIAGIGKDNEENFSSELTGLKGRRRRIMAGMLAIDAHEEPIAKKLRTELAAIPGLSVYGPAEGSPRTPTVSFTIDGIHGSTIGKALGEKGIFVWDGDFYAIEIINHVLDLEEKGGLVRIGLAPYNTIGEIDRTIEAVKEIASRR